MIDNTNFKIAIYIRLSREDGDDLESESVTNQRSLLIGYLKAHNLDIIDDFLNMKNPTKEIMNRLIDKIYVTKDKKIEIHYRIKKSEVLV